MTATIVGDLLARLNAGLNLLSLSLLLMGYVAIRRRQIDRHRVSMQAAFVTSAVFLVSYVTRFALTGAHHLAAGGWVKAAYLALLLSHMVLAAGAVPLVLRTLWLARSERFEQHRSWAKVTFPVWLYVSVTGIAVYVVLYHVVGTRD